VDGSIAMQYHPSCIKVLSQLSSVKVTVTIIYLQDTDFRRNENATCYLNIEGLTLLLKNGHALLTFD